MKSGLALLFSVGLLACVVSASRDDREHLGNPQSAAPVAFLDVRLFDGTQIVTKTTVLVRNGVIENLGQDVDVPDDAVVVQGEGRTLLPGLIDAHTHVNTLDELRQALAFGVTTELEMMGDPELAERLRRRQAQGLDPDLASLLSAGHPLTVKGGHGTEYGRDVPTVNSPREVPNWLDARIAEGSDYIKIMYDDGTPGFFEFPVISQATLFEAVRAAHARHRMAIVHISSEADAWAAIEAGADGLAHFPFAGIESPTSGLIRKRDVFTITTLAVFHGVCDPEHGDRLADDPRIARYLSGEADRRLRHGYPMSRRPDCGIAREALGNLLDAGVILLAGTDAGETGTAHGASMHDELALLVAAGMSPGNALSAATRIPAEQFGLSDRGVVAIGKRADLLLVEGDPTRDVSASRAIVGVWKLGRRFDHEGYRATLAGQGRPHLALSPPSPATEVHVAQRAIQTLKGRR